jgi:protein TonB
LTVPVSGRYNDLAAHQAASLRRRVPMNDSMSRPGFGRHPVGLAVVVGLHVALAAVLVLNSKLHLAPHREIPPVSPLPPEPPKPPDDTTRLKAPPLGLPLNTPLPIPPIEQEKPLDKEGPAGDPIPFGKTGPIDGPTEGGGGGVDVDKARPVFGRKPAHIDAQALSCRPTYPALAARNGATGLSRIRFTVDALGRVIRADTLQSAGPTREHRLLDRAAADALQSCPITPGTDENGKAVGTTVDVEYRWALE